MNCHFGVILAMIYGMIHNTYFIDYKWYISSPLMVLVYLICFSLEEKIK